MKSNTSNYIPSQSVSANMLENYDYPDYPFFSGTGFFAIFPPYEYIFYITAKHCFAKCSDNKFTEKLKIPYEYSSLEKTSKFQNQAIIFSEYLTMEYTEQNDDYEDILIFIVDDSISQEKKRNIKRESLNFTASGRYWPSIKQLM